MTAIPIVIGTVERTNHLNSTPRFGQNLLALVASLLVAKKLYRADES